MAESRLSLFTWIKQFYSPELKNSRPQEAYTLGDDEQRDDLESSTSMIGKVTKTHVATENKVMLIKGLAIMTTYIWQIFNTTNQFKMLICGKTIMGPKKKKLLFLPPSKVFWLIQMDRGRLTGENVRSSRMHMLGGFAGYETWNGSGSSGLEGTMDQGETGAGAWEVEGNRHFTGSWGRVGHMCRASSCWATQKQCLPTRPLAGAVLPAAKVRVLRFPSWNGPFHVNLLGRKGERPQVCSESSVSE